MDSAPQMSSGSDMSEKSPLDFGLKAVSLKSQSDTNNQRCLPTVSGTVQHVGQLRTLSATSNSPKTSNPVGYGTITVPMPTLSNLPAQRSGSRVGTTTGNNQATKPIISTVTPVSTPHQSPTYFIPRGQSPINIGNRPANLVRPVALSQSTISVLSMPIPTPTVSSAPSSILTRGSIPSSTMGGTIAATATPPWTTTSSATTPSTTSGRGSGSTTSKSGGRASSASAKAPVQPQAPAVLHRGSAPSQVQLGEIARPLVLHAAPPRPPVAAAATLTSTTQLLDKTGVKVSATQPPLPLRASYCANTGYVTTAAPSSTPPQQQPLALAQQPTVLTTTPVRLATAGQQQQPLLGAAAATTTASTQRVGSGRQQVTAATLVTTRLPTPSGGSSPRNTSTTKLTMSTTVPPIATVSPATGSTFIATTGRIAYPTPLLVSVSSSPPITRPPLPPPTTTFASATLTTPTTTATTSTSRIANHHHHPGGKPSPRGAAAIRQPAPLQTPQTSIITVSLPSHLANSSTLSSGGGGKPPPPGGAPNHVASGQNQARTSLVGTTVVGPKVYSQVQPISKPLSSTGQGSSGPPNLCKQVDVITLTPSSSLANRTGSVISSQPGKIYTSSSTTSIIPTDEQSVLTTSVGQQPPQSLPPTSNVYIQTTHRTLPSTANLIGSGQTAGANTLSTYTLPGGASYFYEAPSGYQLATDAPLVARPLSPDAALVPRQLSSEGPLITRPYTPAALLSSSTTAMRFNPVMIVESTAAVANAATPQTTSSSSINYTQTDGATLPNPLIPITASSEAPNTPTKSPRPSILRKRENDCLSNSLKTAPSVVKNLSHALSTLHHHPNRSRTPTPPPPTTTLHCDTQPPSAINASNELLVVGPSSNGSTTISATSSPGGGADIDEQQQSPLLGVGRVGCGPMGTGLGVEGNGVLSGNVGDSPATSPRKKPRKQQLNDANTTAIDMELITDSRGRSKRKKDLLKLSDNDNCRRLSASTSSTKQPNRPASLSLLRSYKHQWKTRVNHFVRPSEVRVKEDQRKITVAEFAQQRFILQRCDGWKVHHLNVQLDALSDMEDCILTRLSEIFKEMEKNLGKDLEKDVNRVNDLIMGNMQRSKVIQDQVTEAETQIVKVFDHKKRIKDIISRHTTGTGSLTGTSNKRNCKKREKY